MKKLILVYLLVFILTYLQNTYFNGFISSLFSALSVFIVILVADDKQWLEKELYNRHGFLRVVYCLIGSIVAVLLFHLFWNQFAINSGYLLLKFQLKEINSFLILMVNLTFMCLIEELLFRGYFQEEIKKLSKQLPLTLSIFYQIVIPTILFSFMHFFKMGFGCLLIIMPSVIFGGLKYYSGNIYSAIGSHLIFNMYYYSLLDPRPF